MHSNFQSQSKSQWRLAVLFCAVGVLVAAPRGTGAPVIAPNAGTTAPGRAASATKAREQRPDDAAAREEILRSQTWQSTMRAFDEWLSAQSLYDAQQVEQIRARLASGIGRMTAAQLQWFLSDMQEKLQVWSSQEARDANTYLAETFAVASPAYTRIIRRKLPDVLAMTAAQVDRQLAIFAAKHQSMLEMQKIFQQSTQQEIAYNEQQILAIREEHEHAFDRAESAAAAWDTSAFFQCDCGSTVWFGCIALEAAVRQSSQRGPFFAAHRAGCSRRASFASLIKLTSDSARFKSSSGVPQDLHCIALTPLARDQEWSS